MKNLRARKIMIVDKLDSYYVEQAIFVLKDIEVDLPEDCVLNEAYCVINNYEQRIAASSCEPPENFKSKLKKLLKALNLA